MAIEKINIPKRWILPVYRECVRDYSHRYEIYYGGAGSGKSVFVAQKIIIKCLEQKRKILVVRKVGNTLRDSVFEQIRTLLSQINLINFCTITINPMSITLPTGSQILFRGVDDPEKIKSITGITDVWIEEATELTLDDFTQIDLRLRGKVKYSQIMLSYNPCSKANWCYKRWHLEDKPDVKIIWTTYKDNTFLSEDYIRTLTDMINTNPVYYKIYALGEFASLGRLVYPVFEVKKLDLTEKIKAGMCKLAVGLDFGYATDPSALVVSYVDEIDKVLYIDREFVYKGLTNPELAELIRNAGLAKERIIADCAEPKSIAELKQLGITSIKPSVKGAGSITHGIQRVSQFKIVVNPECTEVIKELQNYEYKKDKSSGEYLNEPIDNFNHCMDALRYSIQICANRLKTLSKTSLGI